MLLALTIISTNQPLNVAMLSPVGWEMGLAIIAEMHCLAYGKNLLRAGKKGRR